MKFRLQLASLTILLAAGLAISGCSVLNKQPSNLSNKGFKKHTVRYKGESLSLISLWYTKNITNWKKIRSANQHLKGTRLELGDTIRIPNSLVVEAKPYPKNYSRRSAQAANKVRAKTSKRVASKKSIEQAHLTHSILHKGESLSLISLWYTGDMKNWKALRKANPGLNYKRMEIGDSVNIPDKLLVNRDRFPKSFIRSKKLPRPDRKPALVKVTSKPPTPPPSKEEKQKLVSKEVELTKVQAPAQSELPMPQVKAQLASVPTNKSTSKPQEQLAPSIQKSVQKSTTRTPEKSPKAFTTNKVSLQLKIADKSTIEQDSIEAEKIAERKELLRELFGQ